MSTALNAFVTRIRRGRRLLFDGHAPAWTFLIALLIWIGVLLIPRLGISTDPADPLSKIRFEDLLLPLLFGYVLVERQALLDSIGHHASMIMTAWLTLVGTWSLLAPHFFHYPTWVGVAYLGKEIQYLATMGFFAVVASKNPRIACWALAIPASLAGLYALGQLVTGDLRGYYGLALPFESDSPSPSEAGSVFAFIFIVLFALVLNRHAIGPLGTRRHGLALGAAAFAALAIVVGTISRTSLLATAGALVVLVAWHARRLVSWRSVGITTAFLVTFATIAAFTPMGDLLGLRWKVILTTGLGGRLEAWGLLLNLQAQQAEHNPLAIPFGLGLGGAQISEGAKGTLTAGADSQYIRRFFEVGLIGLALWVWMLGAMAVRATRRTRGTSMFGFARDAIVGLLVTAALLGVGFEVLQVIRSATVFYALFGTLLGLSSWALFQTREGTRIDQAGTGGPTHEP